MNIRKNILRSTQVLRQNGPVPLLHAGVSRGVWNTLTSRRTFGTNIFSRDWDLLIILDACRTDALRDFSNDKSLDWLNNVDQITSVGSMTAEWVIKTFTSDYINEINRTSLISGHPWPEFILRQQYHERRDHDKKQYYDRLNRGFPNWNPVSANSFNHFECVPLNPDDSERLHPESRFHTPHITTDRAIATARKQSQDRLIVHYTLPHRSFIADALDWAPDETSLDSLMSGPDVKRGLELKERQAYKLGRKGELSLSEIRRMYSKNLRLGLDYVNILLRNIDAEKVVITADHGEGFGEHGIWEHPYGYFLPPVKTVPWATTTATDEQTYIPQRQSSSELLMDDEQEEFLRDLGYI